MDTTFQFGLGETVKVTVANRSITAVVDSCSVSRHQERPRYYCEWIDAKETVNGRWFDESELSRE